MLLNDAPTCSLQELISLNGEAAHFEAFTTSSRRRLSNFSILQTQHSTTPSTCKHRDKVYLERLILTQRFRLIPKADRKLIHEYLFREGVLVAKKDFNQPKHGEIDTKNLYVIKACQSLTSRGYLKTQFSWQWYYYTLTPEGLDYLREWLHLPAEIVPQTHVKQQRSHAPPRGMMGGGDDRGDRGRGGGRGGPRGDREGGYRRREQGDKEGGMGAGGFEPSFNRDRGEGPRGGFGRGRGRGEPTS
ncbi:hypothetical protein LTR37_017034 [Vermiconidia calcicola]|uniref:Uncharacterized protein n=1 Tax=Vermiconidia calcicola TaxID=1690605 RepID=A0ACC3ML30_9PEZI|nr:hypothetical protein LTR37_017034 [Vermiconidia calcicola]